MGKANQKSREEIKKGMEITKEEAIQQTKEGIKEWNDAIEILKSPDLLLKIIEWVHNDGVQGEEDTILVLTNKINLRLVANSTPTSSNMVVSDKSGGGKDAVTKAVCTLLVPDVKDKKKLFHRTGLSEKALNYFGTNKNKNFTWDECVLYLEDPEEDLIKSQTFKVISSGRNISSVVKDQKLMELSILGKPVIIITSYLATIDEEGGRRWDAVRVDLSQNLTKKVIDNKLKNAEGNHVKNEKRDLAFALQRLGKYDVVIPFASKLAKHLPTTLIMRTQVDKLLDYTKSSTVLHQYQRDRDEEGRLIATWFDYDYARFLFIKLRDAEGQALNKIEEELIEILRTTGKPLSIKELSEQFSHSKKWIYDHLENLESKGLIKEVNEWDNNSNKDIMKVYSDYGYSSLELPDSSVFTGCTSKSENQNREGFHGFHGFTYIYERINKNREEKGLTLILGLKPLKPQNLSVDGFHHTGENHVKTKSHEETPETLKQAIIKNKKAGYKITQDFLSSNFSPNFIAQCIESGLLKREGNGEYTFLGCI